MQLGRNACIGAWQAQKGYVQQPWGMLSAALLLITLACQNPLTMKAHQG
jgi:hypothetical protein